MAVVLDSAYLRGDEVLVSSHDTEKEIAVSIIVSGVPLSQAPTTSAYPNPLKGKIYSIFVWDYNGPNSGPGLTANVLQNGESYQVSTTVESDITNFSAILAAGRVLNAFVEIEHVPSGGNYPRITNVKILGPME